MPHANQRGSRQPDASRQSDDFGQISHADRYILQAVIKCMVVKMRACEVLCSRDCPDCPDQLGCGLISLKFCMIGVGLTVDVDFWDVNFFGIYFGGANKDPVISGIEIDDHLITIGA